MGISVVSTDVADGPGRDASTRLDKEAIVTASETTDTTHQGGSYVDVNGVHTYYEVEGTGDPLVLLHGGLCAIETLAGLRAGLAGSYRVYLPERRGHGRTPDVDGPYSYDLFADDTIAFVDAVGLESAHIVGFSDGATVGLLTALRRPDLVRSLVHIGQQVNPSGLRPEFLEAMKLDAMPQGMLPPVLRELYAAASPDGPEHWDVVVGKVWRMVRTEPDIAFTELEQLRAPTLVMMGEHDIATESHGVQMERAIPDAKLVVVPDATHGLPMEKPDVAAGLILEFLQAG